VGDARLDSAVFIKAGSLQVAPNTPVISAAATCNVTRSWSWALAAAKVADRDATGRIAWRNTVTSTELAQVVSSVTGKVTVISPNGGALANLTLAVTGGTGTCQAPVCPTYDLPFGDAVICTFTCDSTVTGITPSGAIAGAAVTGEAGAVARTIVFTESACVTLSDPLFKQQDASWTDRNVCYNSANPYVVNVATPPPVPLPTECALGTANYTVTNTAVLKYKGGAAVLTTSNATATVACPLASFTTTTATGTITKAWTW
jgi:hypothetical protein